MSNVSRIILTATVVTLLFSWISCADLECECPHNCVCTKNSKHVACTKLKYFPRLCDGTLYVDIRNSDIKSLSKKDNLPKSVRHLTIQQSNTESINKYFFPNGSDVTVLSLGNNNIKNADFFQNIPKLVNLDLSSNIISKFDAFPSLIKLTNLNLNGNKMFYHADVSSALCNMDRSCLLSLHLDGMRLTSFPQGIISCHIISIKPLPVTFLSLSNNEIASLPHMASMNFTALYLSSNKIKDIAGGYDSLPESLSYLVMSNNPLNRKGLATIARLSGLKHLELAGIDNKVFPPDMFHATTKLEFLGLMKCNLKQIPQNMLKNLANLKTLALQSNHLKQIPIKELSPLTRLENLYLDNNKISHVKESNSLQMFLFHLKKFGISHNPFHCDCQLLWFCQWLRNPNQTTKVVSLPDTQCTGYYHGLPLTDFYSKKCNEGKMSLEITMASIAAVIMLIMFVCGLLICCCKQGSSDTGSRALKNTGIQGYQAI